MPKASKVLKLPAAVKAWLDQALVENNFTGYEAISAELKARGFAITKSSLHRYGQPFESRLAAVRLATDQATAVVAASPDDDNAMNDALIRLVQEKVFTVLVETSVGGDEGLSVKQLGQITKAIADVGRASVQQKKYQGEVRARAQTAAETASEIAKQGGASHETIERIKREILGIPA